MLENVEPLLGELNRDIEYLLPKSQEKTVIPSREQQIVLPDKEYTSLSKVTIESIPSDYIKPSGTLDIATNGEYDVKQYEKANVSIVGFNAKMLTTTTSQKRIISSLITEIPPIDISSITTIADMFKDFKSLKEIPPIDTSNVTSMQMACSNCNEVITIPPLDASKTISVLYVLQNCNSLTTLGGFLNLGKAYLTTQSANYNNYKLDLSYCTLLTYESLMNVINNLYDIASAGVKPQGLVLGATNLAKLTEEEIAIATNKGWNVS